MNEECMFLNASVKSCTSKRMHGTRIWIIIKHIWMRNHAHTKWMKNKKWKKKYARPRTMKLREWRKKIGE